MRQVTFLRPLSTPANRTSYFTIYTERKQNEKRKIKHKKGKRTHKKETKKKNQNYITKKEHNQSTPREDGGVAFSQDQSGSGRPTKSERASYISYKKNLTPLELGMKDRCGEHRPLLAEPGVIEEGCMVFI